MKKCHDSIRTDKFSDKDEPGGDQQVSTDSDSDDAETSLRPSSAKLGATH